MNYKILTEQDLAGKIWFMPTDTIPGISALHGDKEAIERIYKIKDRPKNKPLIVLCASLEQCRVLDIDITKEKKSFLQKIWPGPITVAFSDTLSVRVPNNQELLDFLVHVGPVVSTSANRSGEDSICNKDDALFEFGDEIDYYLDTQESEEGVSSTIIKIIR